MSEKHKLVIVESPAKSKTIAKFLGPDYKVAASYGHIRDLPGSAAEIPDELRDKPWARMAVDVANGFKPVYIVPPDSRKHVAELRKLLKGASELLLATDEDREGESISWHLLDELKPDLPVRRITFHEITKTAIQEALAHPRDVDMQLVRAQESRRILDRLFGYSLSPVLWKKVRTKLSAGRVQSVAVRLIVEREEERRAFKIAEYWDVEAVLRAGDLEFGATLNAVNSRRLASGKDFDGTTGGLKPESAGLLALDQAAAERIAKEAMVALPWKVAAVERRETRQRPWPPFTTSTLQQAASSNLGLAPKQTMLVAQRLYEGVDLGGGEREGLITYMRTDSVTLSEKALQDAGQFIKGHFGDKYYTDPRRYQTKSKSAQEAHEAIRPTEISRAPESVATFLTKEELALYRLIWNRAVASQMADAVMDKTAVDMQAAIEGAALNFRANGSVVRFPGFLKVYGGDAKDKDTLLPELKEGQLIGKEEGPKAVRIAATNPTRHQTQPPSRYTEASLIKKLEDEGIGRPSTYAPTISTIEQRDYVLKKGGALIPNYVGMAVVHLLRRHFPHYVDIGFTALMEDELDEIASGTRNWQEFLSTFYNGTSGAKEDAGLVRSIETELPRIEFPAIPVGEDPETGQPITIRIGRNSVYVHRGEGGEGNTATIPYNILIDELTPAKAVEIIKTRTEGNKSLGVDPATGMKVYALLGPFGPYVQLGDNGNGNGNGNGAGEESKEETPDAANGDEMDMETAEPTEAPTKKSAKSKSTGSTKSTAKKSKAPKTAKPKRVSVPRGVPLESVTFEHALKLLSLPRIVGNDPTTGKPIRANLGRFGPYLERDGEFRSLPSADRLFTITLDEALARMAEEKRKRTKEVLKELGAHPESGVKLQALSGRYGPYVSDGKTHVTLPRDIEPQSVTLEQAVAMLTQGAEKKKTAPPRARRRKSK